MEIKDCKDISNRERLQTVFLFMVKFLVFQTGAELESSKMEADQLIFVVETKSLI